MAFLIMVWREALAAAVLMGSVVQASGAETFILCTAPDRADLVIEFDSMTFEGEELTCLRGGGGAIYDMTPCAPDGGFALSSPTGAPVVVAVVQRWQEYGQHLGGVVGYSSSATNYRFQGGFMSPDSGYHEMWTFDVSRLTGKGELTVVQEIEEGGEAGSSLDIYDCAPVERKF